MFNWIFKKVVTMREKVAADLGVTDQEKPFLEHLEDLRTMLVRMAITLLIVTIGAFFFYKELLALLEQPLITAGIRDKITLQNLKPIGAFMTAMNVSLVAGIITSFPLLLYFLLQFILPGLHQKERVVLRQGLAVGAFLFLGGVSFAYFLVSPRALQFFYEFAHEMEQNTSEATTDKLLWERVEYVKFICQFILIFGICFELPVVVMALVKLDILNYRVMKTTRSWAAIIIVVASAIITPTQDVFTLALLAAPLYVLYEICIWLAWGIEKRDRALYPDYYKELEEESKELDVSDDWDNENYNPWASSDTEDEESNRSTKEEKPQSNQD